MKFALRREWGQNLVEFAFVVPLLLVFVLSIFEFGNLFREQLQVQNAVRDGARYAAVNGCPADSAVQSAVTNSATGLTVTFPSVNGTPTAATYNPTTCTGCLGSSNPSVTVSANVAYAPITPLGSLITNFYNGTFSAAVTLSSSSTLRNEC